MDLACEAQNSPVALRLTWPSATYARTYTVRRRLDGSEEWGEPVAVLGGDATEFIDRSVTKQRRYEYEVSLQSNLPAYDGGFVEAYSYISAGLELAPPDFQGTVLLLVDEAVAAGIAPELEQFQQDLVADGWAVIVRRAAREAKVQEVKAIIAAQRDANLGGLRTVVVIGHVPVPYSGNIAPDLHETHRGAWPADVYYATFAGDWTDETVSISSYDSPANDNYPGDGKFDQSDIPGVVQLELGRIDFADLPSFAPRSEIELLKAYFAKDHAFRYGQLRAERRGLVHDNFGDLAGDAPAVDAYRHFSQFFGHGHLRDIGPDAFFPTLQSESFLWAYGCGGGSFSKADGVGETTDFARKQPQAVFFMLHGSYFGDWNSPDNFLRAALASSGWGLASIWSGLPHWYLHDLGLGATLGYATRLTQNNRGAYKSYRNYAVGQVHIALLGDPTLKLFPVIPPRAVTLNFVGNEAHLSWSGSTDQNIVGYKVYHSAATSGPYEVLTTEPIATTRFTHMAGTGPHVYMVRAVKLEHTGSGTFYNLSEGILASGATGGELSPSTTIHIDSGTVILTIVGSPHWAFHIQASDDAETWTDCRRNHRCRWKG